VTMTSCVSIIAIANCAATALVESREARRKSPLLINPSKRDILARFDAKRKYSEPRDRD
jgi:hypothetical protein